MILAQRVQWLFVVLVSFSLAQEPTSTASRRDSRATEVDDRLLVRVVDEEGAPLPAMWVAALGDSFDGRAADWGSIREWLDRGAEGPPDARAMWHETDREGMVRVRELTTLWTDLLAVGGERGGRVIVPRGGRQEVNVVALPHRYWSVKVVDPQDLQGRPQVPVRLKLRQSGRRGAILDRAVPTGPDHLVRFGPVDLLVDPENLGPVLEAQLEMLALAPERIRRSVAEVSDAIDRLVLPPHGSVQIEAHDPEGRPVEGVQIRVELDDDRQLGLPGGPRETRSRQVRLVDGIARFDWVEVGADLLVNGGSSRLTEPGELQILQRNSGGPGPRVVSVTGRLVDPRGRPRGGRTLGVLLHSSEKGEPIAVARSPDPSAPAWAALTTDADGRFEAVLTLTRSMSRTASLVIFERGPKEGSTSVESASAPMAVDVRRWEGGELGDVVTRGLPILAAGTVVDRRGRPVASAGVCLDDTPADAPGALDGSAPSWWSGVERVRAVTDEEGRFALRGWLRAADRGVGAGVGTNRDRRPLSALRQGELRFVLDLDLNYRDEAAGRVAGRLLLDPPVPRDAVSVELRRSEERGWRLDGVFDEFPGDRFGIGQAQPGNWELLVRVSDFAEASRVVHRIPAVEVRVGELTELPVIDLRGEIEVARLELRDAEGRLVPYGHAIAPDRITNTGSVPCARFYGGELTLWTLDELPRLEILGHGCRKAEVRVEAGNSRCVLPPELRVELRVLGEWKPPEDVEFTVIFDTEPMVPRGGFGRGGHPPDRVEGKLDESGRCSVRLPMSGSYDVWIGVLEKWSTRKATLVETSVDFEDTDELQTVDVAVDPAALKKALGGAGR